MGSRTDGALATVVLLAVVGAGVWTDASFVVPFAVLGGLGTLAFELVAARDPAAVRRRWERPAVQLGTGCLAIGTVAVGARVAPSAVLSTAFGVLATYLSVLGAVAADRSRRSE